MCVQTDLRGELTFCLQAKIQHFALSYIDFIKTLTVSWGLYLIYTHAADHGHLLQCSILLPPWPANSGSTHCVLELLTT